MLNVASLKKHRKQSMIFQFEMKTVNDLSIRDVISWNALISVYAEKGRAEKALDSLKKM